jgi:hypothetical protein
MDINGPLFGIFYVSLIYFQSQTDFLVYVINLKNMSFETENNFQGWVVQTSIVTTFDTLYWH